MNIEHIRAFLEIASAGSFQEASERLHITQSAISARIKMLEDRLNRQLYVRKRAGVELTEAGRRFMRHAQSCVQSWERAQQEVALPTEIDNLISLGIQLNFWERVTAPWNEWMASNAPQLATRIISDYSEKLVSLVRDGMLDLALVYNARQSGNLVVEEFMEEELILVSTRPRALNKGWTPGYVFVDWSEDFLAQHNAAFPESPPPKLSVGSASVALAHILEHGGSGYFLRNEILNQLAYKKLTTVEGAPVFKRKSFVVYPKDTIIRDSIEFAVRGLRAVLDAAT